VHTCSSQYNSCPAIQTQLQARNSKFVHLLTRLLQWILERDEETVSWNGRFSTLDLHFEFVNVHYIRGLRYFQLNSLTISNLLPLNKRFQQEINEKIFQNFKIHNFIPIFKIFILSGDFSHRNSQCFKSNETFKSLALQFAKTS